MKTSTRKLTLSALFLALGLVLPLITGQLPQIGKGSRALGTACKIPVCFGHLSCTEIPEQLLGDPARS